MNDHSDRTTRKTRRRKSKADDHTVQISLTDAIGNVFGGQLTLVIANDHELSTRALPEQGRVVVGRAETADMQIGDPSLSRHHFAIETGPQVIIEDLGSSNGTRVGDRILRAKERAELGFGVPAQAGHTTFVLRRVTSSPRPRRIVNHGYFELRVEEESVRADEVGGNYAVVRISSGGTATGSPMEQILFDAVKQTDVVGAYGPPGEYEILLVQTGPDEAQRVVAAIEAAFELEELEVLTGLAVHPRDGASPDRIIACAGEALRGDAHRDGVGRSLVYGRAMVRIHELVDRVAIGRISVLVLGETGVGKEVLAEQIHLRSRRASAPMLTVNCASLNEELLASELFGHARGAFTGAVKDKIGLIEAANGGSLFLDEIGDVASPIQAKLLRVLEEQELTRVGEVKPRPVDVRFVSATNRDLERGVREGTFREDLYYRLAGITIVIPPLRERSDEIVPLARAFVQEICERDEILPAPGLAAETVERLLAYNWPGNIRELRNMVERAVLLCGGRSIEPEHLLLDKMGPAGPRAQVDQSLQWEVAQASTLVRGVSSNTDDLPDFGGRAVQRMRDAGPEHERQQIVNALEAFQGNQTKTARALGISRGTLIKRLEQYGLLRPRKREDR